MLRELFQGSSLLDLPVIAMLVFLAIFLGVLVWVLRRTRTPHFERMAALPLDDEVTAPRSRTDRSGDSSEKRVSR